MTEAAGAPRARAGLIRALGWPVRRWHRSLRVRVVTATFALAAVVLTVLGVVLSEQVGRSLVDAQRRQALAEADTGLATAQKILRSGTDPSTALPQVDVALNPIASRAATFEVLLLPTDPLHGTPYVPIGLLGVQAADVPASLRKQVVQQQEAYAYTDITTPGGGTRSVLIVGAPLSPPSGTSYEMYYVFPLDQVQSTLGHIRTRLLEGAIALVVLLMAVAVIVARQVVTPVRLAARTASRFAAGQLAERMDVRGGDDLAQLATAFNEMAGALQQQIARLEDLSRVQRRFTADVSHELRTPLTTVRMAADVLFDARDSYPPAVARSAELLQSELNRFEGLLADLLEISRYDANAAVLEVEPVDVVELVLGVVDGAAALAAGRGVTLDVSDVPRTPVLAEVDPRRVSRILRNLVTNAVEYSEGRPVEIALRADEATVAVRVRDHGPGLRPGDATRVFDRFWRADPSRARNTGGTGLGLSIALEDARLHGGWLGAWGRPGEGAAFRLVLPRTAGRPVLTAPLPLEDVLDVAGAR
ncbi:MAG TPA: MtrAB system histidine kinase MtrB [Mycobacteriales bacterium]|nr:MtrAB system histidine kinase MtrB [Mycobacteriales bacterium]